MGPSKSAIALIDQAMSKPRNFRNLEGSFHKDHLMGLIIQKATQSRPAINTALMGRLEVSLATYNKTPNLDQVIEALEACTCKDETNTTPEMTTTAPQGMDFHHLNLQGGHEMSEIGTDGSFAEDNVDPAALHAIIKGTCHLYKT
ncbi:hypothetical protein O181_012263 [Austropuccinia psidii MF-1]|uniref:Uncharacterized protein n=1 Tax=Austropuccinia psidii MF-1 TaxID=1389203 RepID=A0A9Q3BWG6_9BASI|nr:hypothetical protein [Austropuccinia psidii MF-1]